MTSSSHRMDLKRRREGKTDYRHRLRLLKSGKTRAVVRMSNKRVLIQFIDFHPEGDLVRASANSNHLEEYGWKGYGVNLPSAYLVGYLAGKKALKERIKEAVLDIGLNEPEKGGRIFSALKGIVDSGVHVPHNPEIFPSGERIKGGHISDETLENFEKVKSKLEEL